MKLFCCSDIHSAYTQWMKALEEAGFDKNNDSHKIILCGDLFDRMDESLQVYYFMLEMLNNNKIIYVKGNHESLMLECAERGYPSSHDWSNGTAKSIIDLAPHAENFYDACQITYEKVKPLFDKTVNYFETKNYIFVHSWIPVNNDDGLPYYYTRNRKFSFNPDWRYAHYSDWEAARWGNPFDMAAKGFLPDKIVVFGHWHTSWPRYKYNGEPEWGKNADFSPYFGDGYIGIDACCAHSGKINVLVIEDEFLDE